MWSRRFRGPRCPPSSKRGSCEALVIRNLQKFHLLPSLPSPLFRLFSNYSQTTPFQSLSKREKTVLIGVARDLVSHWAVPFSLGPLPGPCAGAAPASSRSAASVQRTAQPVLVSTAYQTHGQKCLPLSQTKEQKKQPRNTARSPTGDLLQTRSTHSLCSPRPTQRGSPAALGEPRPPSAWLRPAVP